VECGDHVGARGSAITVRLKGRAIHSVECLIAERVVQRVEHDEADAIGEIGELAPAAMADAVAVMDRASLITESS
jgi:hypothetical protein